MHCDKNAHEPDRQIFDTLLRRDLKTLSSRANLAESWRLLNETTWPVQLRRGSSSTTGALDAAAVKYSIERMLNPKQGAPGRTSIATSITVDVVDGLHRERRDEQAVSVLPVRMSSGHCGTVGIVPPKYIEQVGAAGSPSSPSAGSLTSRGVGEGRAARARGQPRLHRGRRPFERLSSVRCPS